MTAKDITDFRTAMGGRLSPGSVNTALKIVRTAMNQARRDGMISVNEAQKVATLGTESSKRRPFTLPEVQRLLAVAGSEWRGMILVALSTGLRIGDVAQLTWANVNLQQRELALVTTKTDRPAMLPIAKPVLEYLSELPSSDDSTAPLFPSAAAAKERSEYGGTLSNQFYQLLVTAGLAPKRPHVAKKKGRSAKRQVGGLSFHCLRHTATNLLKNAGVSDVVVAQYRSRNLAEAAKALEAAVALEPENPYALRNLGGCLFALNKDLGRAEECLRKAVAALPQDQQAWVGLGNVLERQGRREEADEAFKKTLEINFNNDIAEVAKKARSRIT